MLDSERYADDRHAEEKSEADMKKRYLDASEKDPDYVHQEREAASVTWARNDLTAERPQCKSGDLQKLQSERYADNGDAEQKSDYCIVQADHNAAQHYP